MLSACLEQSPLQVIAPVNEAEPQLQAASSSEQDVSFQLDLSAIVNSETHSNPGKRTVKVLAPGVMTGSMLIENMDTGVTESRPWITQIDDSPFPNIDSVTAAALTPGIYTFTLSVNRNGQQYVGSTLHAISENETDSNVPMTLRPVIGNTTVDVEVAQSLIEFGISYPPNEIGAAGLIAPAIAISIDGAPEKYFDLNPATGLSDDQFFINLTPGQYEIRLKFFDTGLQIGESLIDQELVTVTGGNDIEMDIAPLYGEINFDFFTEGSDATLEILLPADVVDETGGLNNLTAVLRVVGAVTPFFETPLLLTPLGPNYSASVTVPQLSYDDITYEILIIDNTRAEEIGHCIAASTLNAFSRTLNCPLLLERRSVVTGTLLSKLGVNVFDAQGIALPGAVIRIDGEEAGITGGSTLSTQGYTRLNVEPGQRLIRAEFGPEFGELIYDSIPLNVTSVNLHMGQTAEISPPLLSDNFIDPQTGNVSPMAFLYGCNGQGNPAHSTNNGNLELKSHFTDVFDYCTATSAITEYSFTDIEIVEAGGFQISVDIAWSDDPTSGLAIGIGENDAFDMFNFSPTPSVDAMIDIHDNEIVIRIFDNGTIDSVNSYTTGIPAAALENVTIDVETPGFEPGAPATLTVMVNGAAIPSIDYFWDGGGNHIEIRGGTTASEPAMVAIDNLIIRPR